MRVLILTAALLSLATPGPVFADTGSTSGLARLDMSPATDISAAKKKKVAKPQRERTAPVREHGIGAGRYDPSRAGHSRLQSYRN